MTRDESASGFSLTPPATRRRLSQELAHCLTPPHLCYAILFPFFSPLLFVLIPRRILCVFLRFLANEASYERSLMLLLFFSGNGIVKSIIDERERLK